MRLLIEEFIPVEEISGRQGMKSLKTPAFELHHKREQIDPFDRLRETRHADQHDASYFATREDAESALGIAFEFVERIEKLLGES